MARDYDSYVFNKGVTPNTLSVISSKNRIFAYNAQGLPKQLGVVATFDPSEARTLEPVRGIGFGDYIAELVPGVTDPMTISITRTALYLANIYQIFGYKSGVDGIVRSLRHHRWPFDINQEIVFSTLANRVLADSAVDGALQGPTFLPKDATVEEDIAAMALVTIYEACWMSDYSVSFASDTALVQETVTVNVSNIIAGQTLSDSVVEAAGEDAYSSLSKSGSGLSVRLESGSGI